MSEKKETTKTRSTPQQKKEKVLIYCDGACSHNPGAGGWGAVLLWGIHRKDISGYEDCTTNNRMELTAAIQALSEIKRDIIIEVYTDSTYLKNGITLWLEQWKISNWKKGKIKNIDLWQKLDNLATGKTISWHWVKSHAGNKYNEEADKLAKNAIKISKTKG
jgi:ribonuclease HI